MVIFLLNYLGCNFVIVESVESVTLIMVDFIAAKTAPQQLGPTATVEVQLLGCLLRAALLHPCHFRVGGPLPEFHQSLPWSELLVWSLWSTPYSQSRDIYDLNARLRGIPSDGAPLAPTTWGQLIIDNLA